MAQKLHTPRLDLYNCDLQLIELVLEGNAALAHATGWIVPDDWTQFGEPVFQFTKTRLQDVPEDAIWWSWLPVIRAENRLVGSCGYVGCPDTAGVVEIGYEVAASRRQLGYATEMAEALVAHAFSHAIVVTVRAHTLPEQNPSTRVLHHCGFVKVGESVDPDEGPVWRWELPRAAFTLQNKV